MTHVRGGIPAIRIPDPSLVVLVGASGAGKTTFAARHFEADEVISSDRLRAVIGGDETNQGVTRPAFSALHRAAAGRLAAGRLVVVDATNVQREARAALLRRSRTAGVPSVAIVLAPPDAVCLARNRTRPGRVVDEAVVLRQLLDLGRSLASGRIDGEGFDLVVRLSSSEAIEAARIERLRA